MSAHQQQNTFHSNHIYVCYIINQVRNRKKEKMLILYLCTPKIKKKYIGNHSNWLSSTCFHQFFFLSVFCFFASLSHFLLEGSKECGQSMLTLWIECLQIVSRRYIHVGNQATKTGTPKSHIARNWKGEKKMTHQSTLVRMLLLEKTPPRERIEKKNVEHEVICVPMCPNDP